MILEIFACKTDIPLSKQQWYTLMQCVSPEKLNKINSCKNKHNADNSLIGIVLVKAALYKIFHIPIKDITLEYTKDGKPYISSMSDIYISISHSDNLVVCAVSDRVVGIDVEKIRDYNDKIANKYFNTIGKQKLKLSKNKDEDFTTLWTEKEASLKCLGTGFKDLSNQTVYSLFDYTTTKFDEYIITTATKKTSN